MTIVPVLLTKYGKHFFHFLFLGGRLEHIYYRRCDSGKAGIFEDLADPERSFVSKLALHILEDFGDSTVATPEVVGMEGETFVNPNIVEKTLLESILEDQLLLINIGFLLCALIVALFAYLHVRLGCGWPRRLDISQTSNFMLFALQVWDISSDILFVREAFQTSKDNDHADFNYGLIAVASLFFLVTPWCTNMVRFSLSLSLSLSLSCTSSHFCK